MTAGVPAIFRPATDEDRQGLADLLQRHGEEAQEYLADINARPVTVTTPQAAGFHQ